MFLSESSVKKVDSVLESMPGLACLFFGMVLVLSALQGAQIIPAFMLRDGVTYTAFQAVGTLLIGEALLAGAAFSFWAAYRSWQGR